MSGPVLLLSALHEPTQRRLEERYQVHHLYKAADKAALLASLAGQCEVAVTTGGRGIDAATMGALPGLRLVACFGVGVDAIDLAYCRSHGIAVTNTPDVLTDDVADLAIALLLASLRQVVAGDRWVREGHWVSRGPMPINRGLAGLRVGIVGLGRIGAAIALRCNAFRAQIAYHGPNPKPVDWPYYPELIELARWADVLIAASPGGEATRGLVSREVLEALGPDGHFINIARGSVVDQAALISLLSSGGLAGAGLDVFDNEPHVPAELIALPQVVLQPHQASATRGTRDAMGGLVLDNLDAWFAGKGLVTPV